MKASRLSILVGVLGLLVFGSQVNANQFYTVESDFEAAVGPSTLLDNFDDFLLSVPVTTPLVRTDYTLIRAGGSVTAQPGTEDANINSTGFTQISTDSVLQFTFDNPVKALSFEYAAAGTEQAMLVEGGTFSRLLAANEDAKYLSMVFDDPISSFDFSNLDNAVMGVDNLSVIQIVPEPATAAILLIGSVAIMSGRERQARRRA